MSTIILLPIIVLIILLLLWGFGWIKDPKVGIQLNVMIMTIFISYILFNKLNIFEDKHSSEKTNNHVLESPVLSTQK